MKSNSYSCYQLAATLNRNEWNRFLREVLNGSRCSHHGTQALIRTLANHYPDFDVNDTEILKDPNFIPQQTKAQLRVLRTNLKNLLRDFLVESSLARKKLLKEQLIIEELIHREKFVLAEEFLQKASKKLPENLLNLSSLEHAQKIISSRLDLYMRNENRNTQFNWLGLLDNGEIYEHVQRLVFLSAWKSMVWFRKNETGDLAEKSVEALETIERFGPDRHPLLKIYFHLLSMLSDREPAFHQKVLQDMMIEHGGNMDRVEVINILGIQVNALAKMDLHGIENSISRAFELYRYMVERDLLFNMGSFSINSTRNILTIGVRLKEFDWTANFLELARKRLPEDEAKKFYPYGSACLHFAQKEYAKVRMELRTADFEDPFYSLTQRMLLLRTYFMERDSGSFMAEQDALRRQLYRNQRFSKSYCQSSLNFLKVIGQLNTAITDPNSEEGDYRHILQQAAELELPHRAWLNEQIWAEIN